MEKVIDRHLNEKSGSKGKRFVLWIILPLLLVLIIGLAVMSISGINIFEKAEELSINIPFLPKQTDEAENRIESSELIALQGQIKDQESQMDELKSTILEKDQSIAELQQEIEQQSLIIEELREVQEDNKREFNEIVSTFESMSAKNAAPILIEMDEFVALQILSRVDEETLASILENMPPADAARFAQSLTVFIPTE
ncbi:flagellar motility protein MotE (MotC chaperone) [Bacillus oleivorans]|uniref:Flagellar motility protein MotE (MotC chaperone) n=1 Tax=Bacillus oleivorans TaxID=1448271 RepID=A0A285D1G8_9BACI|nr:hypothetical protein [Bacillus oleivorans]SNX73650.1 flagellar motility protein MotE (MotC chaperone) [Bacillus oleivorans]